MKVNFTKCITWGLCCIISITKLTAQVGMTETVIPKSPQGAAIDRLNFMPIGLATGGTNISYELLNIKQGSIHVPVNLSYHGGGIRLDECATGVGLGWVLDGGGMISRKINGNPDEGLAVQKGTRIYLSGPNGMPYNKEAVNLYGVADTSLYAKTQCSNFFSSNAGLSGGCHITYEYIDAMYNLMQQKFLRGGNWIDGGYGTNKNYVTQLNTDIQNSNSNPSAGTLAADYPALTSNLIDPQPDEFHIKIPGYSGTFMFRGDGTGKMIPQLIPNDKDLKISVAYRINEDIFSLIPRFASWIITTTEGLQYYFGNGANATTNADGSMGERGIYMHSPEIEWHLTKIVDLNTKDSVVFSYNQMAVATAPRYSGGGNTFYSILDPNIYMSAIGGWNWVAAPFLTKMESKNQSVDFYSSKKAWQQGGESFKVDSIAVTDHFTGAVVNKIRFNYDLFKMSKRLKLVSFQTVGGGMENVKPPTSFQYFDTIPGIYSNEGGALPVGLLDVNAQDYWGYFNNASNSTNFKIKSPAYLGPIKKAAWPYMQLDVLTEITAPTAGKTQFE